MVELLLVDVLDDNKNIIRSRRHPWEPHFSMRVSMYPKVESSLVINLDAVISNTTTTNNNNNNNNNFKYKDHHPSPSAQFARTQQSKSKTTTTTTTRTVSGHILIHIDTQQNQILPLVYGHQIQEWT